MLWKWTWEMAMWECVVWVSLGGSRRQGVFLVILIIFRLWFHSSAERWCCLIPKETLVSATCSFCNNIWYCSAWWFSCSSGKIPFLEGQSSLGLITLIDVGKAQGDWEPVAGTLHFSWDILCSPQGSTGYWVCYTSTVLSFLWMFCSYGSCFFQLSPGDVKKRIYTTALCFYRDVLW